MVFAANLSAYRYRFEGSFSQQLVAAFLIYTAQITATILFLGVVIKNLGIFPIVAVNVGISVYLIIHSRKCLKGSVGHFGRNIWGFARLMVRRKNLLLFLLLLLFILQVVLLLVKIHYLPPHVWDSFAYHLHPVVEWKQQNHIPAFIDSPVTRVNRNPLGSKLLHFWFIKFTGNINLIEMPQFLFGLIVLLAAYAIMGKIVTGDNKRVIAKRTALKYALLIYFIPLILLESRTCQDHLVMTGAMLMVMLYFIDVFYRKNTHNLIFLALALGVMLGTKISTPQIIFIFFLSLVLGKGFNGKAIKAFVSTQRKQIPAGVAIVLGLGGYWFLKQSIAQVYLNKFLRLLSWKLGVVLLGILVFGVIAFLLKRSNGLQKIKGLRGLKFFNILGAIKKNGKRYTVIALIVISMAGGFLLFKHKELVTLCFKSYNDPAPHFKKESFYRRYPLLKPFKGEFLSNLLVFPFRIKDLGLYTPYTPDFLNKSGFGIQFFVFGLLAFLAILYRLVRGREDRGEVVGFIFIFSVLLLASYFLYYYTAASYRMYMFFPVGGLMLWAYWQEKLNLKVGYRIYIDLLLVVMVLFNLTVCFYEGNSHHSRWKTIFTAENHLERTSIKYSYFFKGEDWQFIDAFMAPHEPLGYLGEKDSWVFPYFDNGLERRIHHLRSLPGFKLVKGKGKEQKRLIMTGELKKSLKARSIHFLHLNPQGDHHRDRRQSKRGNAWGFGTEINNLSIDDKSVVPVTENLYYFKW